MSPVKRSLLATIFVVTTGCGDERPTGGEVRRLAGRRGGASVRRL